MFVKTLKWMLKTSWIYPQVYNFHLVVQINIGTNLENIVTKLGTPQKYVIFCTIYLFLWLKTKYYLYVLLITISSFDCSFVWHWPWCIVLIIHVQHKIIRERSNRNKRNFFIIGACQNIWKSKFEPLVTYSLSQTLFCK